MWRSPMTRLTSMPPAAVDSIRVTTREAPRVGTTRHPILVALVSVELGLLALQYVLGMFVNLYVTLPSPILGMYGMMRLMFLPGMGAVMAHMLTGMVLGALALLTFAASALSRNTLLLATTGGTFAAVLGAGISGMEFLFSGQNNAFSYGMSVGFLLAFTLAFLSLLIAGGRGR